MEPLIEGQDAQKASGAPCQRRLVPRSGCAASTLGEAEEGSEERLESACPPSQRGDSSHRINAEVK